MRGYLLDTNVISELRKGGATNPGLSAWYAKRDKRELFLSVITLAELRRGVRLLAKRDKKQSAVLGAWCDAVTGAFSRAGHLLGIRTEEAESWADLSARRPLPIMDAFLAATAKTHGLVLVTRNAADFKGLHVNVENPFSA